ncbi:hypothetical protein [Dyadobacter beijingensis]|uniref:hypothetical protein n=1 Tax=Dyadobacter beijingensis TaxID=365489 RepID=UPI000368FC03|nr:hypothetical protein [Dyadobacter beijingensis]
MQKEARYGTSQRGNVEKIYNSTSDAQKNGQAPEVPAGDQLLTDSQTFEFASADTTSKNEPAARLVNQRLLHISANSKLLNY